MEDEGKYKEYEENKENKEDEEEMNRIASSAVVRVS